MPRLTQAQWAELKVARWTGKRVVELAREYGISHAAISKRAKAEAWLENTDVESAIRRKVAEKVTGIVTSDDAKKRDAALDSEAEKRAKVIERHRIEIDAVRERLYAGLAVHKSASERLKDRTDEKALRLALAEKKIAFEDLKAAKISSECMQNIHLLEWTAWGLDTSLGPKDVANMTDAELDELLKHGFR